MEMRVARVWMRLYLYGMIVIFVKVNFGSYEETSDLLSPPHARILHGLLLLPRQNRRKRKNITGEGAAIGKRKITHEPILTLLERRRTRQHPQEKRALPPQEHLRPSTSAGEDNRLRNHRFGHRVHLHLAVSLPH